MCLLCITYIYPEILIKLYKKTDQQLHQQHVCIFCFLLVFFGSYVLRLKANTTVTKRWHLFMFPVTVLFSKHLFEMPAVSHAINTLAFIVLASTYVKHITQR